MILEAGERERDERVPSAGEAQGAGDRIAARGIVVGAVAHGADRDRIAAACEVPQQEVEMVDELLHDPGADAARLVAPAAGAAAVGKAEQGHHRGADVAQVVRVDQRLDGAPLLGQPQLVTHAQHPAPGDGDGGAGAALRHDRRGRDADHAGHNQSQRHGVAAIQRQLLDACAIH